MLFNRYVANHPRQIRPITELDHIPRTILVISNTALGDTILSTPAIKSLKRSFPTTNVVALIHKNYLPLLRNFPYIDTIVPYHGGYKKFLRTIRTIRKVRPEMTLIFHGNGPQDIQLAVMSGSKYILKHPTDSPLKKYLSYDFEKKYQHTIEDRLDLVRKIGGTVIDREMSLPPLRTDGAPVDRFKALDGAIGFQIGASYGYRRWPKEYFVELAKKILATTDHKIVITGSKDEQKDAQYIVDKLATPQVFNMCGRCTIEELPYLIDRFSLLVTNDTGPMHLAIALKKPTLSLFHSMSDPRIIGPYQDGHIHRVIQSGFVDDSKDRPKKKRNDLAMRYIEVDEVFDTLLEMLKNEPKMENATAHE